MTYNSLLRSKAAIGPVEQEEAACMCLLRWHCWEPATTGRPLAPKNKRARTRGREDRRLDYESRQGRPGRCPFVPLILVSTRIACVMFGAW
eukprot:767311-Hanusia_phi.AAC.7